MRTPQLPRMRLRDRSRAKVEMSDASWSPTRQFANPLRPEISTDLGPTKATSRYLVVSVSAVLLWHCHLHRIIITSVLRWLRRSVQNKYRRERSAFPRVAVTNGASKRFPMCVSCVAPNLRHRFIDVASARIVQFVFVATSTVIFASVFENVSVRCQLLNVMVTILTILTVNACFISAAVDSQRSGIRWFTKSAQ